jgi:hypothetical protein
MYETDLLEFTSVDFLEKTFDSWLIIFIAPLKPEYGGIPYLGADRTEISAQLCFR